MNAPKFDDVDGRPAEAVRRETRNRGYALIEAARRDAIRKYGAGVEIDPAKKEALRVIGVACQALLGDEAATERTREMFDTLVQRRSRQDKSWMLREIYEAVLYACGEFGAREGADTPEKRAVIVREFLADWIEDVKLPPREAVEETLRIRARGVVAHTLAIANAMKIGTTENAIKSAIRRKK